MLEKRSQLDWREGPEAKRRKNYNRNSSMSKNNLGLPKTENLTAFYLALNQVRCRIVGIEKKAFQSKYFIKWSLVNLSFCEICQISQI